MLSGDVFDGYGETIAVHVLKNALLILISLGGVAMNGDLALAKAAYAGRNQMIDCSEIIAVVEVKSVTKVQEPGQASGRTYSQKATMVPLTILKGALPKSSTAYGGENFICASCNFEPGKFLVFLNHDGQLLIGSNWHLSIRPIKADQLDWYDGEKMNPLRAAKLTDVLAQIRSELGNPGDMKHLPTDFRTLATAEFLDTGEPGEAPAPSPVWQAFTRAQKSKECADQKQLMYLFKNGTPAGRFYASMLVYHLDKEAGKKLLAMLCTSNGTVTVQHGCRVTTAGVWQVASDLYSNSKYLSLKLDP
ncbi:MAG: hypothetical protein U0105_09750 [Candidatus Obscuribacterales bacterium]